MMERDEFVDRPYISVIVPIYNEERYIERCARSLVSQDYPKDRFEVLFVDNNSSDRSAEIARGIEGIRVLSESTQGDYAARNRGSATFPCLFADRQLLQFAAKFHRFRIPGRYCLGRPGETPGSDAFRNRRLQDEILVTQQGKLLPGIFDRDNAG